jgi:hypothetical protein
VVPVDTGLVELLVVEDVGEVMVKLLVEEELDFEVVVLDVDLELVFVDDDDEVEDLVDVVEWGEMLHALARANISS